MKVGTDVHLVHNFISHSIFFFLLIFILISYFFLNLKFSKLTEILWYRGIGKLLYTYYNFKIYFLKIVFIHVFWINLVAPSEVLRINGNLVQGYMYQCIPGTKFQYKNPKGTR